MGGEMMPPVRAVIFDFDGVILESADIKTEAFRDLFADFPDHVPAILAYHTANVGISRYLKFEWIYRELLHQPLSEEEKAALGERFSALALDKILRCPFVPGAQEALAALAGKALRFVASGTPQAELEMIVQRRGLARSFEGLWGSPTTKDQAVRAIQAQHALAPNEIAFVGDGQSDLAAAQATGIRFVARSADGAPPTWLPAGMPCIGDLRQLVPLFGAVE